MDNKVIFIVGPPRSGTTLVLNMLIKKQPNVCGSYRESSLYPVALTKPYSLDTYLNYDFYNTFLNESEIKNIYQNESTHVGFFKTAIQYFLNKENKHFFVEKSPAHLHYLHDIVKDFNQPLIICLKRNPAAIINSIVRTNWISLYSDRLPATFAQLKSFKYFSAFATYYRSSREFKSIERYNNSITVNYEDIVLSKIDLKSMVESKIEIKLDDLYIHPPYSADVDHKKNKLDRSRIDGYKKTMPRWAQKMAEILFQPTTTIKQIFGSVMCMIVFEPLYQLHRIKKYFRKHKKNQIICR